MKKLLLISLTCVVGANTSYIQQNNKLTGTQGITTTLQQGFSTTISGDSSTLASGGPSDDNGVGAIWMFTRNNTGSCHSTATN
jgi:hypothetical protein